MKLMILDGNSIINRAFYGIRMLNAPDGTPTNAVYGFLSTFRRVFDLAQPQAVCVAFDVHAPTFRHEQYALYKDKGLQVVSISIDKDANAWKKAVKEEQLQWPNFLSPAVADQYRVKAVPTMYLLDSDGKVVAESDDARGEKLAAKLAELFK